MIRRLIRLLRHGRPQWRLYLAGALVLLAVDTLDTFTPKVVQWGINHVQAAGEGQAPSNPLLDLAPASWHGPGAPAGGMWMYGVLIVLVVALTGVFRYFMSLAFARAGARIGYRLRGRFFRHVQRLDASWHDRTKVGDHMSLATNDVEACRWFFHVGVMLLLDVSFYFVLVPAYMLSISPKLTLLCAIPLPLIPLVVAKITHTVERRFEAVQAQFATVSESARESFSGARVVKSFAREENELRRFAKQSLAYMKKGLHFAKVSSLEHPLLLLMLGLADLVLVIYGGTLAIRGEIRIGDFVAFSQYLIRLSGPMIELGFAVMLFQRARVSMDRIEETLAVAPAIREPADPADVTEIRGGIEFRDVTFAYAADAPPAIRDLSFSVRPGGTLGIVGRVGSGKTTILNLIPRLYDPPPGTVFVDGHDVRDLPLGLLRRSIGAVPQEPFLFGETLRRNVEAGIPAAATADGRVERALRSARIEEEVLALPNGYDTRLGERGVNLSGGQKQRVSIARALAREPSILLLDDCLSAVDTETEDLILAGMRDARRDRTAVIVSHRVSAVRDADEILVLDGGAVVERGTHDELVAQGGVYADLERKQTMEADDGRAR